jgi:hypothetical protein
MLRAFKDKKNHGTTLRKNYLRTLHLARFLGEGKVGESEIRAFSMALFLLVQPPPRVGGGMAPGENSDLQGKQSPCELLWRGEW